MAAALGAAVVALGVGAAAWYASTSAEGRAQLDSASHIAESFRRETGAGAYEQLGRTCRHPVFQTSARYGSWSQGAYSVVNNMWDEPAPPPDGPGSQRLYVCSFDNWYVVADQPAPGQPSDSVKTYPNVQENFASVPLRDFSVLSSSFAERAPRAGDYEYAYDTWLNGVASAGSNEVMIWNEDHGQTPAGSPQAVATIGGKNYMVWRTAGSHYIAFVAAHYFSKGTLDLLGFYRWLTERGWLREDSRLDQVDYGVEICSTGGAPAVFSFTGFSLKSRY